MIWPLLNEEKLRLQKLSQDKTAIFALKKLFMNTALKSPTSEVQLAAAERLALDIIQDSFRQLENVQPDNETEEKMKNLI